MSKNFELLQQIAKEHNLFQTPGGASKAVKTANYEPAPTAEYEPAPTVEPVPTVEIKVPKPQPKKPREQFRWPELVKQKGRSVSQEVPRRNPPRGLEWAKVTRREELKLVQRIFPLAGSVAGSGLGAQRVPQVVIFSGVEHGHSAPTIGARCCEVLAERGDGPVCAIDANLESPFLHRYFGLTNSKGLSEALCDSSPVNEFVHKTKDSNLWVMPTGAGDLEFELSAHEVSQRLKERVTELRTFFKYVLIHSPAYSVRAAATPSFGADGLVLIVEANSTRREAVREVMEEIRMLGTPILGVVLNNRTFPIPDAIYHKL